MQIILLKNVAKLGGKGEVKSVTDGYALNFLIPQKKAIPATKEKLAQITAVVKKEKEKINQEQEKYNKLINKLRNVELELTGKASDGGKLFASITSDDIVNALKEKEIEIERKHIKIDEKIKDLGKHRVKVGFGNNLKIDLIIKVKSDGD